MSFGRQLLAELLGTALLVAVVVGSGITAQRLSPGQIGLQLLANSTATVLGLVVLIVTFGPVSGAHFNPLVSVADWLHGRPAGDGLTGAQVSAYAGAQAAGGIGGAVLANLMFDLPAVAVSHTHRDSDGQLLGEVVATAGLLVVIAALTRTGRTAWAAPAVAAWIGAAYWFTSSTSFANPAVTLSRVFTNTFTGIAPGSAVRFMLAQGVGAIVGMGLVAVLYPRTPAASRR